MSKSSIRETGVSYVLFDLRNSGKCKAVFPWNCNRRRWFDTSFVFKLWRPTITRYKFGSLPSKDILHSSKFRPDADDKLTLSQTTKFRFLQTERVCKRQFLIWWKWHKVFQMIRKHWDKEKLLVRSNFSFSQNVFKSLVLLDVKPGLVWERVKCGVTSKLSLSLNAFHESKYGSNFVYVA